MSDRKEDLTRIAAETRDIWNANAAFWSEAMGDGNSFHLHLVAPAVERLLAVQPGQKSWIWPAAAGTSRGGWSSSAPAWWRPTSAASS